MLLTPSLSLLSLMFFFVFLTADFLSSSSILKSRGPASVQINSGFPLPPAPYPQRSPRIATRDMIALGRSC